jgi:hypothetical protein
MAGDSLIRCPHETAARVRLVLPGGYVLDYCADCLAQLESARRALWRMGSDHAEHLPPR